MCSFVCICIYVCEREKEVKSSQIILASPPFLQSSQAVVGVGYANTGRLSACPFRGNRAVHCSHTLTHAECRGLGGSSPVSRSHTHIYVCVYGAGTFLETHSLSVSLLSSGLFLLSPPPAHLCVVAPLPLPLQPH